MSTNDKITNFLIEKFEKDILTRANSIVGFGAKLPDSTINSKIILPLSEDTIANLSIQELYEKMKEISPELIDEMYAAKAASEIGDTSNAAKHLEQMKIFFEDIKRLKKQISLLKENSINYCFRFFTLSCIAFAK